MYNNITLIGRWTRDLELSYSQNGLAIAKGSLAVSDSFDRDHTDFVDVTIFRKQAESAANYTRKGSKVAIGGRLRQERWEKDGQKRSKHVVIANQVVFLDSKEDAQNNNSDNRQNNTNTGGYSQTNTNTPNHNQSAQNAGGNNRSDPFTSGGAGQAIEISDDELPF